MNPRDFEVRMSEIALVDGRDPEMAHDKMDSLMVECLRALGYGDGCDIFENQKKWYA